MKPTPNKKVTFHEEELEVKPMAVYRGLCIRRKQQGFNASDDDSTDKNLELMAEVVSESLVSPKMTTEEVMALDLVLFTELFTAVSVACGLSSGNELEPETTS